jgi:hypothetical protein
MVLEPGSPDLAKLEPQRQASDLDIRGLPLPLLDCVGSPRCGSADGGFRPA